MRTRHSTAALLLLLASQLPAVTVTLTAPKSGGRYEVGAFIGLSASVVGEAKRVEFWAGQTKVGESTASPYSFRWTQTNKAGNYDMTAKVVAGDNSVTASAAVPIRIKDTWDPDPVPGTTKAAAPLPYRIVSMYRPYSSDWNRFDLFHRAAEAGYNGVMFQTAGGLVELQAAAKLINDNKYVDSCHALGLKVTVWTTELTDVAEGTDVSVANTALWDAVDARYEKILTEIFPTVDGIVLRVAEGDVNVSNPESMVKLITIVNNKCKKYGKELIFRFFVHSPGHLENMLEIVPSIPEDVIIMPKIVPQDWHMRSIADPSIGRVGKLRHIIEFDLHGEYWGGNEYPNCMVDLLMQQYAYLTGNGAVGVCSRIDRGSESILAHPLEVNMWALGLLSSGKVTTADQIWNTFAGRRYGSSVAAPIIDILKTGSQIRQESLYKIRFANPCGGQPPWDPHDWTDTNRFPWVYTLGTLPQATCDADTAVISIEDRSTREAMSMAKEALARLEKLKGTLADVEYRILWRQLAVNNYAIITAGSHVVGMCISRIGKSTSATEKSRLANLAWQYVRPIREQAALPFVSIKEIKHQGCTFTVDSPFPGPWNAKYNHEKWGGWVQQTDSTLKALGFPESSTPVRQLLQENTISIAPSVSCRGVSGAIEIRSVGASITGVYSVAGRLVASPRASGPQTATVMPRRNGTFIVRMRQGTRVLSHIITTHN